MNSAAATHVRHLPTGEIVRIIDLQSGWPATLRCEFGDGHQAELPQVHCSIHVTAAEIAEYQRNRALWHTLAFFNPPTSVPPARPAGSNPET